MRIAIVDDDRSCLDDMTILMQKFGTENCCEVEPVSFESSEAFFRSFDACRYAAAFLDIFLGGSMDGIAVARRIRARNKTLPIIFLTSSMEHMPSAFSCHAFDYVVKPLHPDRLAVVLRELMDVLHPERHYIELHVGRQDVPVCCDEIAVAVSDRHYVDVRLRDGRVLRTRMTMREFEALLEDESCFVQINKGILVNADEIAAFERNTCVLENGERLPVRVRDRAKIEQAARDCHFQQIRDQQKRGRPL